MSSRPRPVTVTGTVPTVSGRTILLCTHHMEEADMLSNRIAIVADGRVSSDAHGAFSSEHSPLATSEGSGRSHGNLTP